jgi:hypothetical protein
MDRSSVFLLLIPEKMERGSVRDYEGGSSQLLPRVHIGSVVVSCAFISINLCLLDPPDC